MSRISDSRLKVFHECQRKHWYLYVLRYNPVERTEALDFGDLGHQAQQAWWGEHKAGRPSTALAAAFSCIANLDTAYATKAKLRVLMAGYDERWGAAMPDYEVLGVEQWFQFNMLAPNGRIIQVVGKIDALVRQRSTGRVMIVEHKFTKADLGPASDYWRALRMEPQVSMYYRGVRALGYEPAACIWDAIKRPDVRPYQATPEESRKYTKAGALYANQRAEDETPEEFETRIADLVAADPNGWYARREVVRLQEELEEFDKDVMATALQCLAEVDHAPRNYKACFAYGRPCEFLGPCEKTASLDDVSKYVKKEKAA